MAFVSALGYQVPPNAYKIAIAEKQQNMRLMPLRIVKSSQETLGRKASSAIIRA